MADLTNIEWCDATLNLWWGCTKVSDGCKFCYALDLDNRYHPNDSAWGQTGRRREVKTWRSTLNKISKRAKSENRRLRVFCQSMSDTFEGPESMGGLDSENWKLVSGLRLELFRAIKDHPELDFLLLTKRPENVSKFIYWSKMDAEKEWFTHGEDLRWWLNDWRLGNPPPNAWIGTSVEDQETADERIPPLLRIPAAVRFLSCEPLLGLVWLQDSEDDLIGSYSHNCLTGKKIFKDCDGAWSSSTSERVHWVICGGESGKNARPMNPDWARSLRDQCQSAGVPFFFKQWGEWVDPESLQYEGVWDYQNDRPKFDYGLWDGHQFEVFARAGRQEGGQDEAYGLGYNPPRQAMHRVGKKRAGRMLDGREWSEFPKVAER